MNTQNINTGTKANWKDGNRRYTLTFGQKKVIDGLGECVGFWVSYRQGSKTTPAGDGWMDTDGIAHESAVMKPHPSVQEHLNTALQLI